MKGQDKRDSLDRVLESIYAPQQLIKLLEKSIKVPKNSTSLSTKTI